jgi:replicative DNA helicase
VRRADALARLPVQPHSVEAEQALLGGLLIDSTAWSAVAGIARTRDIFRPDHREIFAAIDTLARKGETHDVVTVSAYLEKTGRLEAAGGLGYLSSIARDTPTAANVRAYAQVVRDRAAVRALATFAADTERSLIEGRGCSAEELITEAIDRLLALQSSARTGRGLVGSEELARELVDDLDRRREERRGLRLGLADFDELTGGLEPGDLVVIAARPAMGKTALLVTIASHVEKPAAIFSAEMPALQLMRRAVALEASVSQGRLRRAELLTEEDWNAITPALSTLARRPFCIDDSALPALTHIRAECFALKARAGLGLVLVDYVQLVQGAGANRYEQLRDVAYGLKALAKDLAVPIVMLAQLNRGVESREYKRPHLSDLRDSGAIEEAADIVGLLYSEGYYDHEFGMPYVLECNIEKHRNGERGRCLWRFAGEYSRITVLEPGARTQYVQLQAKQRRASDDL